MIYSWNILKKNIDKQYPTPNFSSNLINKPRHFCIYFVIILTSRINLPKLFHEYIYIQSLNEISCATNDTCTIPIFYQPTNKYKVAIYHGHHASCNSYRMSMMAIVDNNSMEFIDIHTDV